jgi:hypothetical protein
VDEVLERCAPKQRERLANAIASGARVAHRTGLADQALEALEVELAGLHAQPVSRRLRHDAGPGPLNVEDPTEARHVRLERGPGAGRRGRSPEPVDEPIAGYDLVAPQEKHGEGRPLLCPAEREDASLIEDLERT